MSQRSNQPTNQPNKQPTNQPTNINYDNSDLDFVIDNKGSRVLVGNVSIESEARLVEQTNPRRQVKNFFANIDSIFEIGNIKKTIAKPVAPLTVEEVTKSAEPSSSGYASQRSVFDQVDAPSSPFPTFGTPSSKDIQFSSNSIEPDKSVLQSAQTPGDVSFLVNGQVFHAMRMFLSEKSRVFAQLFQQSPAYRYKINGVDPVVFEAMLCFLSNKNVLAQLNKHQMEGLFQVAHKFELYALKGACEQALNNSNNLL